LRAASAGAVAVASRGLLVRPAFAAETVQAVSWGGVYGQTMKRITSTFTEATVDWAYYAFGSGEVVTKTKVSWPAAPFDISANWDPDFVLMHTAGWLETVTAADVPNLADVPADLLRYRDADGGVYGTPISIDASYWGYRKDLVQKPIRELDDLLDPALKGRICFVSPLRGYGLSIVVLAKGCGGSETDMEPGWAFLKKLATSGNIGRVATSTVDLVNSLNTGETAVTFWDGPTWNAVKKHWPCELLVKTESRSLKTVFDQTGLVIYKGPRAALAKKIVNFMLSPENNEIYNMATGGLPANSKSKAPPDVEHKMTDEEMRKYAYFPDYLLMAQLHQGWMSRWEQEIVPLLK
jgi:putative spermidine/putrescine transport system substrate-binding protein